MRRLSSASCREIDRGVISVMRRRVRHVHSTLLSTLNLVSFGRSHARHESTAAAVAKETKRSDFQGRLKGGPGLDYFTSQSRKAKAMPDRKAEEGEVMDSNSSKTEVQPYGGGMSLEEMRAVIDRLKQEDNDSSILEDSHKRFHNYLRISLTERCNLRCLYCMPEDGVDLQPANKLLSTEEIVRIASLFAAQGVDKIRLTGGEPLIRQDLVEVVRRLCEIEGIKHVGLTTNAITLARKIKDLKDAGLTHINVSLDTLDPKRFAEITRRNGLAKVMQGIDAALEEGYGGRLKINCVVMRNINEDELVGFVEAGKNRPIDIRFIEWMPFDDNGWNAGRFFSYADMLKKIRASHPGLDRLQDECNDTTKWWRVPSHEGRLGFITSMSKNFCGTCNRLRITSDGNLKVCLFGDESLSLRDALRGGFSEEDMGLLVKHAVRGKKKELGGHGDMHGIAMMPNRPMTLIGG
ncbi:unnamed protein product [Chrysoparadoxa australica]